MTRDDLIRFENGIKDLWEVGELPSLIHLCSGNEGQLIDIFREIKKGDWVFSSHRNHYHALLSGIPEETLRKGILEGRSMFTYSREHNFVCSAILSGTACIAAGVAWAIANDEKVSDSYRKKVWCFVGDGACENGHAWEAINFVEGHNLPCTFIIEDNNQSVDTNKLDRRGPNSKLDQALAVFKCVRRYEYTATYPHAGAATPFTIKFTPEAIERMKMPKGGRKLGSREPLAPRFWEKVQKTDGCWNWTGCGSGPEGQYGGINILGKKRKAHRVSYELNVGEVPEGLCVLHRCDNPKCVRPDHLFLGTKKDNSQDCIKKGRRNFQINPDFGASFRGSRSGMAKLTEDKVVELRRRHASGESYRGLAKTAGIHHKTIRQAILGHTWSHV